MKMYVIRSSNLGAELKITTNWYDEATPAEIAEAAGVAELRQQRGALLAAARVAYEYMFTYGASGDALYGLEAAIALCQAATKGEG